MCDQPDSLALREIYVDNRKITWFASEVMQIKDCTVYFLNTWIYCLYADKRGFGANHWRKTHFQNYPSEFCHWTSTSDTKGNTLSSKSICRLILISSQMLIWLNYHLFLEAYDYNGSTNSLSFSVLKVKT